VLYSCLFWVFGGSVGFLRCCCLWVWLIVVFLAYRFYSIVFGDLISRLIDTRCPSSMIGTIKVGNQLNGKFKIARLGCSKARRWIGEGADNKACITMLIKSARLMQFQSKIVFRPIWGFVKPK